VIKKHRLTHIVILVVILVLTVATQTWGIQANGRWILIQNATQGYALYVPPSATVQRYDPEGILHIELPAEYQVLTIRVYSNPDYLSVEQWMNSHFPGGTMKVGNETGPAIPIVSHGYINIDGQLAETFVLAGPTSLYRRTVLVSVDQVYLISYPVGHVDNESIFEQIVATFRTGDFIEDNGFQIFEADSTQAIANLSVPYYSQKDPQWTCDQLGTCNCDFDTCTAATHTGIGDAGCFISSQAMIFEYYNAPSHFMTPLELDTCLTNHNGYGSWSGCAYGLCGAPYSPLSSCSPSSVSYLGYSTDLAVLDNDLSNGFPAIAWVDGGVHYVVITGKSGGMYEINDPYYSRSQISPGEILYFYRYDGPVPAATPSWDFSNGLQGWVIGQGLDNPQQYPQGMWFNVSANDPYLIGPAINILAADHSHVYVKMASQTDACGEIYFRRQGDTDFVGSQYVNLPIVADGGDEYLVVDMSSHPAWTGNIVQLRLDPACEAVNGHAVRIDQLALLSNASSWDFSSGLRGWAVGQGLDNQQQYSQGVWFNVSSDDPYIFGPMINIPAADYSHIYLKMASQTDACGEIYFRRRGDASFTGSQYVNLPIVADGGDEYLIVDMSSHPAWTGNIIQLRLDPACEAVNNHAVRIDQLALLSNASSWDFSNGLQGWAIGQGLDNQQQYPQGVWFNVSSDDPYIFGPMINIPAADYPYIRLRMASQTDACGQVYFRPLGDAGFSEAKHVDLPIIADGGDEYIVVDMSSNPAWTGNIIQLRLDPACYVVNGHAVRIDQLSLTSARKLYLPFTVRK
jgi:ribosomal protein L31